MKRLIAFLRIPVLKKTRFLIATSDKPDLGLAKARTRNVMNLLRSMNVSAEHVDESDLITYDYFAPVMLKDLRRGQANVWRFSRKQSSNESWCMDLSPGLYMAKSTMSNGFPVATVDPGGGVMRGTYCAR